MKAEENKLLKDFESNFNQLKSAFKWEDDLGKMLVSLTYTLGDSPVNVSKIEKAKKEIKAKTGAFSSFRGPICFMLAGLCAAKWEVTDEIITRMVDLEKPLKATGFKNGLYLPIAAYTLMELEAKHEREDLLKKASEVFQEMKTNHPFLTGGDDYALCLLMAGHDSDISRIEHYYELLMEAGLSKGNGLQMLSHILTFSEKEPYVLVERVMTLYQKLRDASLKVPQDAYPSLGILALVERSEVDLTADLVALIDGLKKIKSVKWQGRTMLLSLAAGLLSKEEIEKGHQESLVRIATSTTIETIIMAQQAAMIGMMAATTAATSAAT